MEAPTAKRRKTSPLTAAPVESTTPPEAPPHPTEPALTRASFASPTKASLARHNPDILLRRQSSPLKLSAEGGGALRVPDVASPRRLRSSPRLEASSPQPDKQLREDNERAATLYQRPNANLLRSPTREIGGSLAARPRRTPNKPNPRPLPPPGSDDDDDIINPFARRGLRRSPVGGLPEFESQELELPPTPVHQDPAFSTPPVGIHSTPSRRPRRSKALSEKIKSSPTKQPPIKPAVGAGEYHKDNILPTTEKDPSPAFLPHRPPIREGQHLARIRPRPSDVRGVEAYGSDAEKQREREALLAEIAQLKADLATVALENERIRQLRLSRKEIRAPPNATAVVKVLQRHSVIQKKNTPNRNPNSWIDAALDPMAFLPFSKPSFSLPSLFSEDPSTTEPEQDPVSHKPLPLTAQEALPFLQAFTPLNFVSRITIVPCSPLTLPDDNNSETNSPLLQHHSITVTSASAPGLFSARIEMTVNTATHSITSLAVPSLSPSAAASELAPLIAQIVSDSPAPSSALSRNVSVLSWAMGSWLRVALRRAKVWRSLDRELGTPEAVARMVARVRTVRRGQKPKRKGYGDEGGADDEQNGDTVDEADSNGVGDWIDSLVDTDDILPYMQRLCMDIRVPVLAAGDVDNANAETDVSLLRIQWRIELDWTGEASSRIRALVSLPGKWHRADERTGLCRIPALFEELLRKDDNVVGAVETIVTLLAGEQKS